MLQTSKVNKNKLVALLRWSERYTKTDMVYFISGGFWLVLGQVGALVFSLLSAVAFGHLATADLYGNYKYVLSLAGLLSIFSLSGLSVAISQAVARGREGALAQGFSLSLRASLGTLLVGLLASLYYYSTGNTFVALALILVSLSTPIINSLILYDGYLVGRQDFRREALYSIANTAFISVSVSSVLLISNRAIVIIGTYLFASLVITAFLYYRTRTRVRNNTQESSLLSYSANLSLMSVISAVADRIDSIVIFSMIGPTQLGIYAYAIAIPEQLKAVIKSIIPLSMPKYTQYSLTIIKKNIWGKILFLCVAIMLGGVVYIVAAPWIFTYLFPRYTEAIIYSQVYMLSILFACVTPLVSVFQAHKRTKELYILSNIGAITLIMIIPAGIYFYGLWGAIFSQFIYRSVNMAVACILFIRMKEVSD